jgi:hypothetical protein
VTQEPLGSPAGRTPDPDDPEVEEPDFAGEHDKPSLADEREGGAERAREDDSPTGPAGMD